jgi:hypothetical protein
MRLALLVKTPGAARPITPRGAQKKGAEDAPDMCVDHDCDAIDLLRR